jgi:hypothetical protein
MKVIFSTIHLREEHFTEEATKEPMNFNDYLNLRRRPKQYKKWGL